MKIIKSTDGRKRYPDKIEVRGRSVDVLTRALSQFPKGAKVDLEEEWRQSYMVDKVFTLTYDRDFKEVTIKKLY